MGERRRGRWWGRAAVVVLAVALVACSSGSDGSDDAGGTFEDNRTEAQLVDDREAATRALPVLDDFPLGWAAEPRDDDPVDGPDFNAEMAECLGVDPALMADSKVEVKSDTFSFDDAEVEADVSMLPTRAYADEAVGALLKPEARGCFEEVFSKVLEYSLSHPAEGEELPAGVEFGEISFGDLNFVDVGEDSRAFRISMPIEVETVTVELYADIVFIRVGRAMGTLSFLNGSTPFDQSLATRLATEFAAKLPTT